MLRWSWRNWPLALLLTLAIIALMVGTVVGITLLSIDREQHTSQAELEQQADLLLNTLAVVTEDQLFAGDSVAIQNIIAGLGVKQIVVANRVYDGQGRTIADAFDDTARFRADVDPFGQRLVSSAAPVFEWQATQLLAGKAIVVEGQRLGAISVGLPTATLQAKLDAVRLQGLVVALLMIGLGALLAGLLSRTITGLLHALVSATERLAGGDLTQQITVGNGRELQDLARAFNTMTDQLRGMIYQMEETAAQVGSAASEISAASAEQAQDSNEQAAAMTQVTATVEQLNQTAMQIADAAAAVAATAEQALTSASHGQESVRDSIIGMAMIGSRVNDITARILALSTQSQRIGDIIDTIDEIAARTHILALNAAVESAGAGGEIGQRFGVVAGEVKKLAQRSAVATREVRQIIGQVQAATNAAVMATEDGLKETEKGVHLAHQSGDANEDIIQMVEQTTLLANAISLASQQQRTASEQVVATMHAAMSTSRQAATISHQTQEAMRQLTDIVLEMESAGRRFNLGRDAEEIWQHPHPPAPGNGATPPGAAPPGNGAAPSGAAS